MIQHQFVSVTLLLLAYEHLNIMLSLYLSLFTGVIIIIISGSSTLLNIFIIIIYYYIFIIIIIIITNW